MTSIPTETLSDHFSSHLRGRRLRSAVFCTYKFDPGFFEQEVLPVFFDISLSHAAAIRLVELEDTLRGLNGDVAVYYDAAGLVTSDRTTAKLDVRRIPVRHKTGIFHPKNVLALVEDIDPDEEGLRSQTLLVGSLSANLTQPGWWENVEVCHVEEIRDEQENAMKKDLMSFCKRLRRLSPTNTDHAALDEVLDFLRRTKKPSETSTQKKRTTQFYGGRTSVVDFLQEVGGKRLEGACLEVLSPYFDKDKNCQPLMELVEAFEPQEVRVHLPRNAKAEALVNEEMYDDVQDWGYDVAWGKLPRDITRLGKAKSAGDRFMHAKVYRFFTKKPKREYFFVGSANLTRAGQLSGGNLESGFFVTRTPSTEPDFWLAKDKQKPVTFASVEPGDERVAKGGSLLNIRYHWDTGLAEAYWCGKAPCPTLRLASKGITIGEVSTLESDTWTTLAPDVAKRLQTGLTTSAFLTIWDNKEETTILVLEEGMHDKPSLLFQLSAADILRYWSLLKPEQRAAFLEEHFPDGALGDQGADLVIRLNTKAEKDSLFDRFAGIFHAFTCLEKTVCEALEEGNEREALYRLFGKKYDSLGPLIEKVIANEEGDKVERYVTLLSAKQLCKQVRLDHREFWDEHKDATKTLDDLLAGGVQLRESLEAEDKDFPAFLSWFESKFMRRAKTTELTA